MHTIIKHILLSIVFVLCTFCVFAPAAASAQGSLLETIESQSEAFADERGAGFGQLRNQRDPREIAARVISVLLGLLGTLFVVYMIYGGAVIFFAAGSEDDISRGKKIITRAIVGLFIIAAAYSITLAVSRIAEGRSLGEPQSNCVYDQESGNWYTRASYKTDDRVFCPNPPAQI